MKLKETITVPIVVAITYGLYYICFASRMATDVLVQYDEYSIISGIVLIIMTLLLPAVFYAKLKGVGYAAKMNFLTFRGSRVIFSFCMLVCLSAGVILIAIVMYRLGVVDTTYSLMDTYVMQISNRELPIVYRCIAYAVLPAFCRRISLPGVVFTEYKQSGFVIAVLFSTLLFAFGQFSFVSLPAFLFVGFVMGIVYYVSESFVLTIFVRLAFNLLLFFFESATWSLILKQSNFVFFVCLTVVLFLLFLTLGLAEAQRIYYAKGIDAEKTPDGIKNENTKWGSLLATAALSPTFMICVAAFAAITLLT